MFRVLRLPILLLALVAAACAPAAPTTSPAAPSVPGGEKSDNQAIRIATSSNPTSMTPAAGFSNQFMFNTIYDSLTTLGRDFSVQPSAATKWEVSADGLTWTFTIRPDLKFSNGEAVTTEDVAFSVNEMLAKAWPSRTFINTVTEARVTSPTTVELKTRSIDMSIPSGAIFVVVLPKKYYEQIGFDGFVTKPIGSGPYELASFEQDRMVLKKRAEHPFRNVTATELTFVAVPEHGQKINGLRTGDLDVTVPIAMTTDQIQASESAGMKFQIIRNAFIFVGIAHGTAELKNTPLKDKRVRQALNYAIDREAISKSLYRGYSEPLGQLAIKGSQSWDPSVKPVTDVALAKRLLAEAGYPNGFGGIVMEGARTQNLNDVMQVMQSQWKEIGVTVDLDVIDSTLYSDRAYGRNNTQKSDLVMSGNGDTNGFNTAIRVLYGCGRPIGGPPAALYYCNPEWDRMQDAAIAERDATKRAQLLRDANKLMREDAPVIPLFLPASFLVHHPKIMGMDFEGFTQISLDGIYRVK
jgi:ABC-type transport system substrate-binding protein